MPDVCCHSHVVAGSEDRESKMRTLEDEKREVREYFESQGDEEVVHLEKVHSEKVFGRCHDVWDVHTRSGRWWVVTAPTNLYSQEDFKSMDVALSFHIGLTARVMALREPGVSEAEEGLFAQAWRGWTQAAEALDQADEVEELQAVGVRLRECLLSVAQGLAEEPDLAGEEPPKIANFVGWAEQAAKVTAPGSRNARLRSYLKKISKETWQYVNWLTHAREATPPEAQIAVDAAATCISALGRAIFLWRHGAPARCPSCGSYRLTRVYRSEPVIVCRACDLEQEAPEREPPDDVDDVRDGAEPQGECVPSGDISTTLTLDDVHPSRRP